MPKRNRKVICLCEKAKILHKERKNNLMLRLLGCVVLRVSLNCPLKLIYVLNVWSPAAVLGSVRLWRLGLVARSRFLRPSLQKAWPCSS